MYDPSAVKVHAGPKHPLQSCTLCRMTTFLLATQSVSLYMGVRLCKWS